MIDSTVLLFWIFCAIVAGAIGMTKNRAGAGVLLGALLGPIGILIALFLGKGENEGAASSKAAVSTSGTFDPSDLTKKCPDCAETIKLEAHVCRYCQKKYSDEEITSQLAAYKNEFLCSKAKKRDLHVSQDPALLDMIPDFQKRFSNYSNEELLKMQSQGEDFWAIPALMAVDLILVERGID